MIYVHMTESAHASAEKPWVWFSIMPTLKDGMAAPSVLKRRSSAELWYLIIQGGVGVCRTSAFIDRLPPAGRIYTSLCVP